MVSVHASTVRLYPQWFFPPEGLLQTPSAEEGIPLDVELTKRREACTIASRVALTLQQPGHQPGGDNVDSHLVSAGAAAFIQRFYMRASVKEYDPWDVGPVCLFLSGKDSEKALRLTHIASCTIKKKRKERYRLQGDPEVLKTDPELIALMQKFLVLEEKIANFLCWEFIPALPYQPFGSGLRRLVATREGFSTRLFFSCLQIGWGFLNDTLSTPLTVLQPPAVIACAAWVQTAASHDLATIEEGLDTFHDWKHHFGLSDEDEDQKDKDDVEECMLWMAYFEKPNQTRPAFEKYRHRKPKPFPQQRTDQSTVPPRSYDGLAPTPAGGTPAGGRSPYEPLASPHQGPSAPTSHQPPHQPNGRNPYEPPPADPFGGSASGMDVDPSPVVTNGVHR